MKTQKYKLNCLLLTVLIGIAFTSCKKYLDAKPQLQLSTITSVADLQALLDNTSVMNQVDPNLGLISSDDYYDTYTNYLSQTLNIRNLYIWDPNEIDDCWSFPYEAVYAANIVLDNITNVASTASVSEVSNVKGQALFFRGYQFYWLSQCYAPPLTSANQNTQLGICLRLTSSITTPSVRSTVQQTYDQIISDLTTAAQLLPVTSAYPTTPTKAAAYGALARTYLVMGDYKDAENAASSCLSLQGTLMNYNTLNPSAKYPFKLFNNECIFYGNYNAAVHNTSYVDSTLIKSYSSNDLRSVLFFAKNSNGTSYFKGDYSGNDYGYPEYDGITVDEMYLIKAECEAREGNINNAAMNDLNTLLVTRWATGTFVPYTATSATDALNQILTERRKELVFRNLRWSDLRRLNLDPNYAITLTRNLNGTIYTLPPNDLRYTFLIPASVISLTGIQQNPR